MAKGRPAHKPTEENKKIVRRAAGVGLPLQHIGALLDIHRETLARHYRKEIDEGKAKAHMNVLNTLYEMAVSGKCPAATFFYCKTQLGFKETDVIEHKRSEEEIVDRPPRMTRKEWLEEYGSTTDSNKVH